MDWRDAAQLEVKFHKGFKHSPESRAKMSASRKGRSFSLETRKKMSAANARFWNTGYIYQAPFWEYRKEDASRRVHERMVQRNYGITIWDVALLVEKQDNICPICREKLDYDWAIDHTVVDGEVFVRGVLHDWCNSRPLPWIERFATHALAYAALTPVDLYLASK